MKKINYLYLLLLTVVTTLWGCSDFEDLNKDDTKLPELGMSHVGALLHTHNIGECMPTVMSLSW